MNPNYAPYEKRKADTQYKHNLRRVLKRGQLTGNPFQTQKTLTHLTLPAMNFKLANGFPLITERKASFWRAPIGELLAFIHGARTIEELDSWGCKWWDKWATPEKCADFGLPPGDLGPGSYGAAFHDFPMPNGGTWNQFEAVIKQIKALPSLRTHLVTSWIPFYSVGDNRKVVVAPCHGNMIQITVINGKLTLRMVQRSGDFPIGVPSNMVQYAALTIMIAHVTGYEPYMYIHQVNDAQMYLDQEEQVRGIVSRETVPYPTLRLTAEGLKVTDLFDFRPEHFELSDYHPGPAIPGIPATI
ncbi:MAG: thymidylate synthase [Patescibacteria group bacterium]